MEYTENAAVGCVIMASGRAVRFGSNKLLADFGIHRRAKDTFYKQL